MLLPSDGTSTAGHLVTSLGVPLTEVGALTAGGRQIPASYRPEDGDVIEVAAITRPQPMPPGQPLRFVLDVHLGTLARRLRLLGVDSAYTNDADDDELIERANAEERVLLTQDRGLLRRKALHRGGYVRGARPDQQLRDVLERFARSCAVDPVPGVQRPAPPGAQVRSGRQPPARHPPHLPGVRPLPGLRPGLLARSPQTPLERIVAAAQAAVTMDADQARGR